MDELFICGALLFLFLFLRMQSEEGFENAPDNLTAVKYAKQIIADNLPWNSYEETKSVYKWLDPVMYERIRMQNNRSVNFIASVLSKK